MVVKKPHGPDFIGDALADADGLAIGFDQQLTFWGKR
jgi:hypothetical protein